MKRMILAFAVIALLSGAAFYPEDDKSVVRTSDAMSKKAHGFFTAMAKEDIAFFESLFAEEVEVEINSITINGKKDYVERLSRITKVLFKDMTFERVHVHTNYFSPKALAYDGMTFADLSPDPAIWTNAWAIIHSTGRTTKKKSTVKMHLDFKWENGKVAKMLAFYDPAFMVQEIAALEASQK